MDSDYSHILSRVGDYYSKKIIHYGVDPRGVDWNSRESQVTRFRQLLKLVTGRSGRFSINDFGCGYGALVDELENAGHEFSYRGFDISNEMVSRAKERYADCVSCRFVSTVDELEPADYTVASGIFNVRLDSDESEWQEYVCATLRQIAALSVSGFAFNALTTYSDLEKRRSDLYYCDPCSLFDYCKRTFARRVTLLHDYDLYEFTILVKRDEDI